MPFHNLKLTVIRWKKIARKIMGLGPITAAASVSHGEKVCDMFKVVSCVEICGSFLHHHELSFRIRRCFPCLSFVFNRFLVNNMRESLWKWAQEVSIKRLINVKSKTMAVNYIRFHSKECYRNSFVVKSMNILCSLSRKYKSSSYILGIHDGEEFFAVCSLFIYYAHGIW